MHHTNTLYTINCTKDRKLFLTMISLRHHNADIFFFIYIFLHLNSLYEVCTHVRSPQKVTPDFLGVTLCGNCTHQDLLTMLELREKNLNSEKHVISYYFCFIMFSDKFFSTILNVRQNKCLPLL